MFSAKALYQYIKSKNIIKNFHYVLLFLWAVIVLLAAFHHEIWYDEAVSFSIVKDSVNNPARFLQYLHEEGHPPLWYLLEYPFANIFFGGGDFGSIQVISFLFMCLAVYYFLFKSPFNLFTKILFIFSSGMTYLLPVIARNYSLIPLFLFILADLYPKRHTHPVFYALIISILSQIHSFMWGFCIICSVLFFIEIIQIYFQSLKSKITNSKIISGYVFSFIILFINYTSLFLIFKNLIFDKINEIKPLPDILSELYYFMSFLPVSKGAGDEINLALFIFCFVIFLVIIFLINKKSFIIFLFSVFCMNVILLGFFDVMGVPAQKMFVIFLFLIFCCWILQKNNKFLWTAKNVMLFIIMCFLFFNPPFYKVIKDEIHNYFSNQPELARYLIPNLNENEKVLFVPFTGLFHSYFADIKNIESLPDAEAEILTSKKIIDNDFLDKYINDNKSNIKYIVIHQEIEVKLHYPYIKVFQAPKNAVTSIYIEHPIENDYTVYMRVSD